ncbi:MAG: ComEC/Rec2 family competence protein [Cecembia sp.]
MIFADFPFLRYLIFFMVGILLYPVFQELPLKGMLLMLGLGWVIYALLLIYVESNRLFPRFRFIFPCLAFLQLVLAGLIFSYLRDFKNDPNHLIHVEEEVKGYLALVVGQDEAKPNSIANRVFLKKIWAGDKLRESRGEVLVYHRANVGLSPGNLIWIKGKPQEIPGPTNPNEFNYQKFTIRQGVAHRHFIGDQFEVLGSVSEFPIESFFIRLRRALMDRMDRVFKDSKAVQIAKALLLGQKKTLDKELSDAYATAGAMHVLAVSGLHVGIIYGFFFLWIKPYRLGIRKRVLYLSTIILLIWAYALLTGMSPSVMRAATMFSIMALAQMKARNPSIFNAIALSALILLVFDPMLIYAVGFQLSYVALLGILLIQPILVKIWLPANKILEYAWQISTVGLAAQVATFPLSAHYFHIFPTYFLLSNLVAIPGAFLIMTVGVPFMLFSKFTVIGSSLGFLTEWIIKLFNTLVLAIQDLPGAKVSGIYLDSFEVYLYFLFLGLCLWLYHQPRKALLWTLLAGLFFYGIYRLIPYQLHPQKDILTIYQMDKGFAIDFEQSLALFTYDDADNSSISFKASPHRERRGIERQYSIQLLEKETAKVLLLPNGALLSLLDEGLIIATPSLSQHELFSWAEGVWTPLANLDTLNLGASAYRVVFD